MPTTFIALQCYQCSTMQVKQQKKSSNKWTCVVCNANQSVTRVFARAYVAKDVRFFVQRFNMSRLAADQRIMEDGDDDDDEWNGNRRVEEKEFRVEKKKKRTDWSEYVDNEDEILFDNDDEKGNAFEPKVVTELPKELFTRPKLTNAPEGSCSNDKGFRPVFQKRGSMNKRNRHGEFSEMESQETTTHESDGLTGNTMVRGKQSDKFQQAGGPSKRNGYENQNWNNNYEYESYQMTRQQQTTSKVASRCNGNTVGVDDCIGNGDFPAKQDGKSPFAAIALKFKGNGVQHEKGPEPLEVTMQDGKSQFAAIALKFKGTGVQQEKGSEPLEVTRQNGKSQFAAIALKFKGNGVQHEKGSEPLAVTMHQKKKATTVSKWNDYITEDDDDDGPGGYSGNLQGKSCRDLLGTSSHCDSDMYAMNSGDQKVEEDVHPDFL